MKNTKLSIKNIAIFCFLLFASCADNRPKLHIFAWANYFNDETIEDFEKKYHCQVIVDSFDSNESMYAKLKLGAGGYDIVVPSNYYLELLHSQNMLEKIDHTEIQNFESIDTKLSLSTSPEILEYAIPYSATFAGIAWRHDRLQNIMPSWELFSRSDLKGRMTLLNDPRETIGAALLYLGLDPNTIDKSDLDLAKKQLLKWKQNLAKFENEQYKNGIASGEYIVVHGYSSDILQVMKEMDKVSFGAPKEGALTCIDYIAIPKGAKGKKLAHAFVNFMFDEENSLQNCERTCLLILNKKIYSKLSTNLKTVYSIFLKDDGNTHIRYIKFLGKESKMYLRTWDQIKSTNK